MTKLQQIVKKAQQIRKQYPNKYSKWTDYIKAASKQIAGFDGVSRQGNKTQVHYSRAAAPAAKKKATAPAKKKAAPAKKKAAPKKAAPAKAVQKSLFGVKKPAVKSLELSKLYTKAFKAMPGSITQKKLIEQIETLQAKGHKLAGTHKDTKSHNLKIVIAGTQDIYTMRDKLEKSVQFTTKQLFDYQQKLKEVGNKGLAATEYKKSIVNIKKMLAHYKKQLRDQNKLINQLLK